MDLDTIMTLLSRYGVFILLAISCLEAMNCPGMPAGVVLPAAGIYAASGKISLLSAILLTVLGEIAGTAILYGIGRAGGYPLMHWLEKRGGKLWDAYRRCEDYLQRRSFWKIFVGRLLPVVRTILPLPAGICAVEIRPFFAASALGIAVYNAGFVSVGYFLGRVIVF